MTRRDRQRLTDVVAAVDAIEIGGAVKKISPELLATEPGLPWAEITGMRDRLAHCYLDISHAIVRATIDDDLPVLAAATERMSARTDEE